MTLIFFPAQTEFRQWLEKNHKTETELFVGFYKIASKKPSMTWSESVNQALCFGWIDGIRRSIDQDSYCIRFTPRRKNSFWSAINIKKIEDLTEAGLMTREGQMAFSLRKENKSDIYSYRKEPLSLSADFEKQFKMNKLAWDFFKNQAPSYQKVTTHWIMSAKQEKTRLSRLAKTINESENQRRIN
ncbi:MAG: YdeI family protein [Prolixibacteraceae bacterium]